MEHARLHSLGYDLFREFARMEYALKAAGFLKRPDGNAEANWADFAAKIHTAFEVKRQRDSALRDAVDGLLAAPPMKQVVTNGVLGWSTTPPQAALQTDLLLNYVRRVRNNLFHGGKFNGAWFAPERADFLIPKCLVVLEACLSCSPEVKRAYDD